MIETRNGVENAAAIAGLPSVDSVFLGPNDLASNMGQAIDSEDVQAAVATVVRAAAAAGTAVGTNAKPGQVSRLATEGISLFMFFTYYAELAEAAGSAHAIATADSAGDA